MKNISSTLADRPVAYITRDLERALPLITKKGHFIITNSSPFAKKIAQKYKGIFLVSDSKVLDTHEILSRPDVIKFINSKKLFGLLVFKNTSAIEKICSNRGWNLLNPSAVLSSKIEEKISQVEWLKKLAHLLPPHQIVNGSKIVFKSRPYIAQFNRAHTGRGTFLIDSPKAAAEITNKYPNRPVRITKYIEGPVFTANIVVSKNKILIGSISYQITGLAPFTSNPFATVGNDWFLPSKILLEQNIKDFNYIAEAVGKKLAEENWRGLFGIDVILDKTINKFYLLEINARQPASTTFESELQANNKSRTTFDVHLSALFDFDQNEPAGKIKDGAQIILRVSENLTTKNLEKITSALGKAGFTTILYPNKLPGSDLLRIMSKKGIMSAHNELNMRGLKIKEIIEKYG
ncbi:MAG: ATP-grasp domain-containing protein [Patescibacteria group bacterium]|jgi:hypothetical protein